jgi:hypothetical protein
VPALAIVLFALLALVTLGGSRGGSKPEPMQVFSVDLQDGGIAKVESLLPPEDAPLVFQRGDDDIYAVQAPQQLFSSIARDVREFATAHPGTTTVYVLSTGDDDIRSPSSG